MRFVLLLALAVCSVSAFGGDRVERIRFHGKPMFMLGVYAHPAGPASKAVLADMASCGMNTLLVPPSTSGEVFAEMDRQGIRAMVTTGYDLVLPADPSERAARAETIRKTILAHKGKPALLGWEGPDEPMWGWKNAFQHEEDTPLPKLGSEAEAAIYRNLDSLKDGYAVAKSVDPDHPVFVNFAPRTEVNELRWFTSQKATGGYKHDGRAAADVFGVDIYPVPGGAGNNGPIDGVFTRDISAVGRFARKQRQVAGAAPMYLVIQGLGFYEWDPKMRANAFRRPTLGETRFMAFECIANGVNGILWWGANYIEPDSEHWRNIKAVAREIAALEPVLAEGETAPVTCSSKRIELIRYTWKGHSYVIAVNAGSTALDSVGIGWAGMSAPLVKVLHEGRTVPASRGKITDSFEPFGVHVYSDDFTSFASVDSKVKCAFGLPLDSEPFRGKSPGAIAKTLRGMGIDAIVQVPEDRALIRALRMEGIKVFAEMSVFCGKAHWEKHPESRPINADGEPIAEPAPGYCGVCPNQDWLRKEVLARVKDKFIHFDYDGVWLDYVRYPGKWEQKRPVLEECCFCDVCLAKFAKAAKVEYPAELRTTKEKAHWILAHHHDAWVRFKRDTITSFVGEIKATMRKQHPSAILGIFNVPWRPEDFGGAITGVMAQDIRALAKHVDVFSPMVYHEMCGFPMNWVADYTDYVWETTGKQVWPIVQVCDEPVKMSPDEVFRTIRTGLDASGSTGVMLFAFRHVADDPAKIEAVREALKR